MKIISYNLNGIRAATTKGFINWLEEESPDVICIQETKAQIDQMPTFELNAIGYESYYFSAQKKGYSGVAILCKRKPDQVIYGMGIEKYDYEGRFIRADYGQMSIISVYHPSGTSSELRQDFKMQWLSDFQDYIKELSKTRKELVICGDYNICHREIDIHDPKGNAKNSGFLPEEREWMEGFISSGYTDSFRYLYPETKDKYSWWSYRAAARERNVGWRIDYFVVSDRLRDNIKDAYILPEITGSDHCPVGLDMSW